MSNTTSAFRPKASFGTKRTDTPGVIHRAKIMYAAILLVIANFPNLPVTMAGFKILIDALIASDDATKGTPKAPATARNTKREAVWGAMWQIRSYVQALADQLATDGAKALIESAGLLVAESASHVKAVLQVKETPTAGLLLLIANAGILKGKTTKQTTFHWEMSADGMKTWQALPSTPHSRTEVSGLTVPGEYWFRVRVTVGTEDRAPVAPVKIQLH